MPCRDHKKPPRFRWLFVSPVQPPLSPCQGECRNLLRRTRVPPVVTVVPQLRHGGWCRHRRLAPPPISYADGKSPEFPSAWWFCGGHGRILGGFSGGRRERTLPQNLVAFWLYIYYFCNQRLELWHKRHLLSEWKRTPKKDSTSFVVTSA